QNSASGCRRAREHDLIDTSISRKRTADIATAGDNIEHAFWQNGVNDLDQGKNGEWGVLGWLEHHGVTHAQGCGELPDRNHHWPVPRANRADHAERTVVDPCGGLTIFNNGVVRGVKACCHAQPGRTCANLKACDGAVEWLARLTGEQFSQWFCRGIDRICSSYKQFIALFFAELCPWLLGITCRLHSGIHIFWSTRWGNTHDLTG